MLHYALASAHHRRRARLRLRGQLHPRAHLRGRRRLRHPAVHREPDAEGTLGGLVEAADRIDLYLPAGRRHGAALLERSGLRAAPAGQSTGGPAPVGAACHGCVLLAESSCERRNDFLDRALVVPTVDGGARHSSMWTTPDPPLAVDGVSAAPLRPLAAAFRSASSRRRSRRSRSSESRHARPL